MGGEPGSVRYCPEDRVKRGVERGCLADLRKARIARTGQVFVPVAPTNIFSDLSWSVFDPLMVTEYWPALRVTSLRRRCLQV